jgi:Ser/Thr protein kinase RdoA (MazF antagonist)
MAVSPSLHTAAMLRAAEKDAIAAAFGLGEALSLTGPVARGVQGQVWRLETAGGAWAVKVTFERLDEGEATEAAAFQEAATLAGVPTPRVARTLDGEILRACAGAQVRVYEWVELGEPDCLVDPGAVGRLLAAIHLLGFEGTTPVDPWYTDPVGATRWHELAAALAGARGPCAAELTALCDELIELEGLLEPPRDLASCHRDLWADNVRPTPSGGLCVIDWDNCGLADRSQELAVALFEFGAGDPARTRSLYRSYVDAGGPGRVSRRAHFSMAIAQLGHIGEMGIAAWLAPDTSAAERDLWALRIEEFASSTLTPWVIDDILAALAGS